MALKKTIIGAIIALFCTTALADDPRYCGPPKRDEYGRIFRAYKPLADFKRIYPCPSTGKSSGACPGWAIDHVVPLACGGCDSVHNLQWLPNEIKSSAGTVAKDRWERKIYCVAGD